MNRSLEIGSAGVVLCGGESARQRTNVVGCLQPGRGSSSPGPRPDLPDPARSLNDDEEALLVWTPTRARRCSSPADESYDSDNVCSPSCALVEVEAVRGYELD